MASEKLNDRGKKEWVQKEDLKWLLATRKEYIRCYYLHLAVDNICENKDRIKGGKETIDNCINWLEQKSCCCCSGNRNLFERSIGIFEK